MKPIQLTLATVLLTAAFNFAIARAAPRVEAALAVTPSPAQDPSLAAASGNALGIELYLRLIQNSPNESLFISPYSIDAALAMVYPGTAGNTAEELRKGLHVKESPAAFTKSHAALAAVLASRAEHSATNANLDAGDRPFSLNVANALWGDRRVQFQPAFLSVLEREFKSPLRLFDTENLAKRASMVNKWADENTNHRISQVVSANDMRDVGLVIANAVYFSATWGTKFDKAETFDAPFSALNGSKTKVPMMHARREMSYAQIAGADVVDIPYKGNDLRFMVIVPASLSKFESSMNSRTLGDAQAALETCDIDLRLPKMKLQKTYALVDSLTALGVRDLFEARKADLSLMDTTLGKMRLTHVDKVVHKTFLEVDERGTEAAAITSARGNMFGGHDMDPKPYCFKKVNADMPFLFSIYDRPTGTMLFLGRFTQA